MRKILLTLFLALVMLYSSGCATVVGGIIGYQSGELLAGLAIGAALDFGDDIATGIGQMLADPEKDIKQAEIDSRQGQIVLPESAFASGQLACLTSRLREIFQENEWAGNLVEKESRVGRILFREKWLCKTEDGTEFEMTVLKEKRRKSRISIEVLGDNPQKRSEITIQIYDWLARAAEQKC